MMFHKLKLAVLLIVILMVALTTGSGLGWALPPETPKEMITGPQGSEVIAASCALADIEAAVEICRNNDGGTVYLPPCDVSLGDQAVRVPAGVSVIGRGKDETILRDVVFSFNGDQVGTVGDGKSRFSGMSIINDFVDKNSYFEFRRTRGMRVDHMYFEGRFSTFGNVILPDQDDGYMLVDHCEFDLFTSYGFYTFGHNTYFENIGSLDCANLLGTDHGSGGAVFIEDSHFTGYYDHLMDGRSGSHYIFRYNTVDYDSGSGPIEGHGPTTPGDDLNVGTNAMEIYNVTINQAGSSGSAGVLFRSGCGVVFDTAVNNKGYGVAMAVETSPYSWPRDPGSYPVYHQPHGLWFWNNSFQNIEKDEYAVVWQSEDVIQENRDYFLRAPSQALDGFTYTPYPYPHPLTRELALYGTPADQAIHLGWDVVASLPPTTTWTIDYQGTPGTEPSPITGVISTTRTYSLTGLTNYELYTITLSAMVDETEILSDTVAVMPTDIFTYLPLVQQE